jgi:hypothetical protein
MPFDFSGEGVFGHAKPDASLRMSILSNAATSRPPI